MRVAFISLLLLLTLILNPTPKVVNTHRTTINIPARRLRFLSCPLAILLRHEPLQFRQRLGLRRAFDGFFGDFLDLLVSQFKLLRGPRKLFGLLLDHRIEGSDSRREHVLFALEFLGQKLLLVARLSNRQNESQNHLGVKPRMFTDKHG